MKKSLKLFLKLRLKNLYLSLKNIGIDLNALFSLIYYTKYLKDKKLWLSKNGKIDKNYIILSDYKSLAGTTKSHYFHQDLLVSSYIFKAKPKRHIDIGSRIDGFVLAVGCKL